MKKYMNNSLDDDSDSNSKDLDQNMDAENETQEGTLEANNLAKLGEMEAAETAQDSQTSNAQEDDYLDEEDMRAGGEAHGEEIHKINEIIGDHTYKSDTNYSNQSNYSCSSWYHVPTPPPSPPSIPLPDEDNSDSSDDNQGFCAINADDYFAKTLADKEVDSIIMLAIWQFGTVTQGG
ncbi:hypothetical protein RHS03_08104, partial [Rhizoctonia solani]